MGLELVEITLCIEDAFDVSFSGEDLEAIERDGDIVVGDLYDLVLQKMHLRDVGRYDIRLNHALWKELRGVIHSVTQAPLDRVELKTPLEALFPPETRREQWERLRQACPYRVRDLEYPKVVRAIGFSLAAAMVLVELLQIWRLPGVRWLWPLVGLFGIWMLVETHIKVLAILRRFRNGFPSGMTTVKDFCRAVLAANYGDVWQDVGVPLDDRCIAVWEQLTEILADTLGIDADRVTFRSRLMRDLGAE